MVLAAGGLAVVVVDAGGLAVVVVDAGGLAVVVAAGGLTVVGGGCTNRNVSDWAWG